MGLDCCKYNRVIYTEILLELWSRKKAHLGTVQESSRPHKQSISWIMQMKSLTTCSELYSPCATATVKVKKAPRGDQTHTLGQQAMSERSLSWACPLPSPTFFPLAALSCKTLPPLPLLTPQPLHTGRPSGFQPISSESRSLQWNISYTWSEP